MKILLEWVGFEEAPVPRDTTPSVAFSNKKVSRILSVGVPVSVNPPSTWGNEFYKTIRITGITFRVKYFFWIISSWKWWCCIHDEESISDERHDSEEE